MTDLDRDGVWIPEKHGSPGKHISEHRKSTSSPEIEYLAKENYTTNTDPGCTESACCADESFERGEELCEG